MISASNSFGRRVSNAGLGVRRPSGLLIAGVFLVWVAVELLLTARFWIQFTGADKTDSLNDLVLSLSRPLVAPFSDLEASISQRAAGRFEYETVVAAEAYLIMALIITVAILVIGNLVALAHIVAPGAARRSRGGGTAELAGDAAPGRKPARLCNTFFLALQPHDALEALRTLGLERFDLDFVTIPAEGGSVVAVFAPATDESAGVPILSRFRQIRQAHLASRLLESIGATVAMPGPAATPVSR